jgi:hypothetical protein
MRIIFKTVGIISICITVIAALIAMFQNPVIALIGGFLGFVNGALMFVVGGLMERVNDLEANMTSVQRPSPGRRMACERCGKLYGVGQSKCPYCGNDTSVDLP